jgi:hypothetical protein
VTLLPYPVIVLISVLTAGVAVCLVTYPILTFLKHKPTPRSTITLFAMGVAGGIIYELLYWPLSAILNWMGQYHINPLALPITFAVILLVLFLLYFPILLFLGGLKQRKALIVAGVAAAVAIPGYYLGWVVVLIIESVLP